MKTLMYATTLAGLLFSTQAFAMDPMKCDDATMTKMNTDLSAMSDPAMKMNKDMAMKQMEMAKTSMQANKMEDCSAQLGMAQMSMTMKCDDATMKMMQTNMDAMTDPAMKANKDAAMKSMEMAKTSMTDKKTDECMMHMGEAMGAMHKKM
jgi:hypothetical protein